jgi:hypothetical protein
VLRFRSAIFLGITSILVKGDSITLKNGDRITGDIQKLEQRRLSVKTDYAGTVNIDARAVDQIALTERAFRVEAENGLRVSGRLEAAGGTLMIQTDDSPLPVPLLRVSALAPAEEQALPGGFWQRLEGASDLGYSLTRGNSRLNQSSLGLNVKYRAEKYQVRGELASLFSRQSDAPTTSRHGASFRYDRYLGTQAFAFTLAGFERDDRQRLDLRSNLGGGLGWKIRKTLRSELSLLGGFTFTNENFREVEGEELPPRRSSGEALVQLDFETATLGRLLLISKLSVHPNLVERGRYRLVYDGGIRVPLISRFTWNLRLFDRFDSQPPLKVQRNDYGVISSFGVSF